jgi:hypothetical protein
VDATVDVFNRVVNNLMGIVGTEPLIGQERVCVESRTYFYVLADFA